MFALFKKKKDYRDPAGRIYAQLMAHIREPAFYTEAGVPDQFIGRFDLLLLHVFMIIHRLNALGPEGKDLSQALFDATFANMDQGLREIGIGDMGVPKRMKKMMRAFNGRMHAYEEALASDALFGQALRRNLYFSAPEVTDAQVAQMVHYVRGNINILSNKNLTDALEGRMVLRAIKQD
jgi:cytochrome b pre-mRNA-processing protein 3